MASDARNKNICQSFYLITTVLCHIAYFDSRVDSDVYVIVLITYYLPRFTFHMKKIPAEGISVTSFNRNKLEASRDVFITELFSDQLNKLLVRKNSKSFCTTIDAKAIIPSAGNIIQNATQSIRYSFSC